MIGKMIKTSILMITCVAFVSCSMDTKSLIEGNVVNTLKDKALSSSDSSSNNSTNGISDNSKNSKNKSKNSGSATGDNHFITSDVVFVSKEPFKGSGWIYVKAAKIVTPPSAKTKNEGEFMTIDNGENIWTKNFWKTRIAAEKELKIGLLIIAFERAGDDGVYFAPEDKSAAITQNWFMAKITDMSDKYRGYVTVSGGYKINLENIRVSAK